MAKHTFQVTDGPLSVRLEPGGQWLKQVDTGFQFVADTDTQRTVDGYIWIEHDDGWSALRAADNSRVFVEQVQDDPPPKNEDPEPTKKYFKTNRNVRVRSQPSLSGAMVRWLEEGEVIETESSSHTEAAGYIWWQHEDGWSASESLDGRWVFMEEVDPPQESEPQVEAPGQQATKQEEPKEQEKPVAPPAPAGSSTIRLQASTDVRVRREPDLSAAHVKWLQAGTVLEFDKSSETTNDGYIWLRHGDGWSARQNTAGSQVFLVEPGTVENVAVMTDDGPDVTTLPGLKTLIKRMPVDLDRIHWFQYFGNNVYAFKHGKSWGYDSYAQGLHSGLDFGNNNEYVPTYAGVEGAKFVREDRFGIRLQKDAYTLIYQHLTNTTKFSRGQIIGADTKLGELDPSSFRLRHLHFEIRYKGSWIINPLYFMSDAMVNAITTKFNPSNPIYFYKSGAWNQWQTPMDQPVIKLGGPVIGPTAG